MKNKMLLFICILSIFALALGAQTTITSLSPASGPIGTQVTITGSGFNMSTATIVFQNSGTGTIYQTRITATSASGTTLTFPVPSNMNPTCYYAYPACGSPGVPTADGNYFVCVVTTYGTSNWVQFTVSSGPVASPPPPTYYLHASVSVMQNPGLTITLTPPGSENPYPVLMSYSSPTTVTLKANPLTYISGSVYAFANWSGDLSGSANPTTLLVDGPKNVVAVYMIGDPLPTPGPTPDMSCPYTKGDVNSSGSIDIIDALMIAQYSVGLNPGILACAADINGDGTIDIVDALLVARCYVGIYCTY